jgi:DNA-binding CsgD family transcriptional regulator
MLNTKSWNDTLVAPRDQSLQQRHSSLLIRDRYVAIWQELPQLTVLAALPGWGRTTWLHQCDDYLAEHLPEVERHRAVTRRQLATLLAQEPPAEGIRVVFADSLVSAANDELWAEIRDALVADQSLRLVLSTVDTPSADVTREVETLTLTERELAFDRGEVERLATLLTGRDEVAVDAIVGEGLRGQAELVMNRLTAFAANVTPAAWKSSLHASDPVSYDEFRRTATAEPSLLWRVLERMRDLYAFSARQLRLHVAEGDVGLDLDAVYERLAMLPVFEHTTNAETGEAQLEWQPSVWAELHAEMSPEQRREGDARALATVRAHGGNLQQLHYLLRLGRADDAERLVGDRYHSLLIALDGTMARYLAEVRVDTPRYPALGLLQSEVRLGLGSTRRELRDQLEQSLSTLRGQTASNVEDEFGRAALLAYASSVVGERSRTARYLEYAAELSEGMLEVAAQDRSPSSRARAAGYYTLLSWTAGQVDAPLLSLRFVSEAVRYGSESQAMQVWRQTSLECAQALVGMPAAGCPALRYLDDGNDRAALEVARSMGNGPLVVPSNTYDDAVRVLIRGFVDHERLSSRDVTQVVLRSAGYWRDGVPSSLVALAAVAACANLDNRDEASRIVALVEGQPNVFARLTRMLWAQWNGEFQRALDECDYYELDDLPRFAVIARVLTAASQLRLEKEELAADVLAEAWRDFEAPDLMRFALRFVPETVFQGFLAMRDSAHDVRNISWTTPLRLTRSEVEVVQLLMRGLKNQEIADARHVTFGTIRTQLKSIYRKLGVSDRNGALAEARAHGLLQAPAPEVAQFQVAGGGVADAFPQRIAAGR